VNGHLRGRLALDGAAETAILTHQGSQDGTNGATTAETSSERPRRGRKGQDAA
jgi:hypothetical protein